MTESILDSIHFETDAPYAIPVKALAWASEWIVPCEFVLLGEAYTTTLRVRDMEFGTEDGQQAASADLVCGFGGAKEGAWALWRMRVRTRRLTAHMTTGSLTVRDFRILEGKIIMADDILRVRTLFRTAVQRAGTFAIVPPSPMIGEQDGVVVGDH